MEMSLPENGAGFARCPESGHGHRRSLSCLQLVILIFYNVSGGPFGSESAVADAGPFLAIFGFIAFPLLWSVPEALVTAELATMFPDDSGYVHWVESAFGPFLGFMEGILSWICGTMDSAIYPALFVDYLAYVVCPVSVAAGRRLGGDDELPCASLDDPIVWFLPSLRTLIVFTAVSALTYMNYRGLEFVGNFAVGLTVFVLLPFAALCLLGLPRLHPAAWLDFRPASGDRTSAPKGVDWVTWLNTLFWNLNYWDTASTLAGEVDQPETAFPRALGWAVVLVASTYVFPLAVCVAALPGQTWSSGFFVQAGYLLGGRPLQYWMLASSAVSNIGQFVSEQAANSHQLLGMAQLGMLPKRFGARSVHGTPTLGLAVGFAVAVPLATYRMESLVAMLNGVYCLAMLLEFAAFLRLRYRYPDAPRPFAIPLGFAGCVCLLAAPSSLCLLMIVTPLLRPAADSGDVFGASVCMLASVAAGCLLYVVVEAFKKARPGAFEPTGSGSAREFGEGIHLPATLLPDGGL